MPCLVRSEMDGRCSTCELLFSHAVSFSLQSYPSSLPWCLPLPATSSGPSNQSHGHRPPLPTTQKKNTSYNHRGFSFFPFFFHKVGWEKEKKLEISLLVTATFYELNSAPRNSKQRGVSLQQNMLFIIHYLINSDVILLTSLIMPRLLQFSTVNISGVIPLASPWYSHLWFFAETTDWIWSNCMYMSPSGGSRITK